MVEHVVAMRLKDIVEGRPMYSINYDQADGIIRVVIKGFWDVRTVSEYQSELLPVAKTARAEHGRVRILCDAGEFSVQSADVAAAFGRPFEQADPGSDRMAIVVGSALAKMQGARAVAGSGAQFFTSVSEAEAWLLRSPG